jgi:hypothetical protein
MDLDSFLVSLYVLVDDWWKGDRSSEPPKTGRPALLTDSEVLTLAILAQWPRFRSERDFWRFAWAHLRGYFPDLCSQSQFDRRARALEPEMRSVQRAFARELAEPSAVYRVLDTTLVPAMVRVRACRKGLFAGQASFGRSASRTEWIYGFKVALVVDPEGVVSAFGLAPAASDERPIGEALLAEDRHDAYTWPTRVSLRSIGRGTGWRSTGLWWRPPRRTTTAGHGRRRTPSVGVGQAPDHRGGDRPAQGLLRPRTPPGQDPERAADASGRQGRGVHLRATTERPARSATAPPGGPVDIAHYTSAV